MDFTNIVGHEDIIKHFKVSIETDRVSHAYLICGEEKSGRLTLANIFAKTLQCEKGGIDPCNACKSCIQAETMNHPDIIYIDHEKGKQLSVKTVREQIIDTVNIKPYSSRYKIYIVKNAQDMNQEAQNALLKTIEEPPQYVIIMLLATSANRFLPTVLSRCMVLNLKPVRDEEVKNYLKEHRDIDEEKARLCASYAMGTLGKAINIASNQDYQMLIQSVINLQINIFDMPMDEVSETIQEAVNYSVSINDYLDLMMIWYRDILVLKVSGNPDRIIFKDNYSDIKKQSLYLSFNELEDKTKALENAKIRINANAKMEDVMRLLILTLKENK